MEVTNTPTAIAEDSIGLAIAADVVFTVQNQGSIDVNLFIGSDMPDLETDRWYIIYGRTETNFALASGESAYVWTNQGMTNIFVIESV